MKLCRQSPLFLRTVVFSIDGVRTGGHCVYCREVVVAVPHRIGYHEAAILDKRRRPLFLGPSQREPPDMVLLSYHILPRPWAGGLHHIVILVAATGDRRIEQSHKTMLHCRELSPVEGSLVWTQVESVKTLAVCCQQSTSCKHTRSELNVSAV